MAATKDQEFFLILLKNAKLKTFLSICAFLTFSAVYFVDYTGSHSNETARWKLRQKYDIEHYARDLHLKTLRDIFRLV